MKRLIFTLTALLVGTLTLSAQQISQQDTIARFKVNNTDDVVLHNNSEGVSIDIAGFKISLTNPKNSEHDSASISINHSETFIGEEKPAENSSAIKWSRSKLSIISRPKFGVIAPASIDYSVYEDSGNFLDLKTYKSVFFGVNLIGLITPLGENKRVYLKSGINLMCYNYTLSNDVTLDFQNSMITPVEIDSSNKKSKFTTTYLAMPLTLSIKLARKTYLEPSVYAGVLVSSNTKYKKPKVKTKHLDGLNQAMAGAEILLRTNGVGVYCNYNFTTIFNKNQGPEAKALTVGIVL